METGTTTSAPKSRPPRQSTSDEIVRSSLRLFNQVGYSRVTTAQIAASCGIREGNLWYHYRTKRDLVLAHLATFEADLTVRLEAPLKSSRLEITSDLRGLMRLVWAYRYLLRDHHAEADVGENGERQIRDLLGRIEDRVRARMRVSVDQGILDLNPTQLELLSTSAIVIVRYWLDYVRSRDGQDGVTEDACDEGVKQLIFLCRPYLSEHGRQMLGLAS